LPKITNVITNSNVCKDIDLNLCTSIRKQSYHMPPRSKKNVVISASAQETDVIVETTPMPIPTPAPTPIPTPIPISAPNPPVKPYFSIIKQFIEDVIADIGKNQIHHGLFIRAEVSVPIEKEVEDFIRSQNYDCRIYDSLNARSKLILEELTSSNISTTRNSVFSMLCREKRPVVILLKDIDGMSALEKGAMNILGKILRSKRTLKQSKEPVSQFPVICVGTFNDDKKTRTLEAGCMTIVIDADDYKIKKLMKPAKGGSGSGSGGGGGGGGAKSTTTGTGSGSVKTLLTETEKDDDHEGGEAPTQSGMLTADVVTDSNPAKDCVGRLVGGNRIFKTNEHLFCIPNSIRTSVGLIIHENMPTFLEVLNKMDEGRASTSTPPFTHPPTPPPTHSKYISTYMECLDSMCISDKIDRTGFQKQMPIFNELSSLLKSMRIQKILKERLGYSMPEVKSWNTSEVTVNISLPTAKKRGRPKKNTVVVASTSPIASTLIPSAPLPPREEIKIHPHELEFTKSLTKYSTQYNNELFIERLNSTLMLDSRDSLDFMDVVLTDIFTTHPPSAVIPEITQLESMGISKLDIQRIKKMLV